MEFKNIKISLEIAKQWYKEGGFKRELVLQAFDKYELEPIISVNLVLCELVKDNLKANTSSFLKANTSSFTIIDILKFYQHKYQNNLEGDYLIIQKPNGKFEAGCSKNIPGKVIGGIYFKSEYLAKQIEEQLNNYFNETSK